jgi:hypothetical protein
VRRKDVISHVAVLMGFVDIMTGYVNSRVISIYEETLADKLST